MTFRAFFAMVLMVPFVWPVNVLAKRAAPSEVAPIVFGGVRYIAVHLGVPAGERANSGFVEARDEKSGRLLWRTKIHTTVYRSDVEQDVQDVFISSMRLDGGDLLLEDDHGRTYRIDLKTHVAREVPSRTP